MKKNIFTNQIIEMCEVDDLGISVINFLNAKIVKQVYLAENKKRYRYFIDIEERLIFDDERKIICDEEYDFYEGINGAEELIKEIGYIVCDFYEKTGMRFEKEILNNL